MGVTPYESYIITSFGYGKCNIAGELRYRPQTIVAAGGNLYRFPERR